jgi:hypothetical protein
MFINRRIQPGVADNLAFPLSRAIHKPQRFRFTATARKRDRLAIWRDIRSNYVTGGNRHRFTAFRPQQQITLFHPDHCQPGRMLGNIG